MIAQVSMSGTSVVADIQYSGDLVSGGGCRGCIVVGVGGELGLLLLL